MTMVSFGATLGATLLTCSIAVVDYVADVKCNVDELSNAFLLFNSISVNSMIYIERFSSIASKLTLNFDVERQQKM